MNDCPNCHEPVIEGQPRHRQHVLHVVGGEPVSTSEWYHFECHVRLAVGSVGHLRRLCSCYVKNGEHVEDPPHMTLREAAIAAAYYVMGAGEAPP